MTDRGTKRAALIVASLSSFVTPFMASSVNIALPAIGRRFEMDAVALSWVATAYLLAGAVFLVPFGRLADIHGRKRVYGLGMGIFTFFSILCGLAHSEAALIFYRVMQGFGSAMIFATGMAILTSVFPPGERGMPMGISVASVYVGLSVGPFVGGFFTQYFTWRSVFLMNVPFGLFSIWLICTYLKGEWAEAKGESFDWAGSLLYGLFLVSMMMGLTSLPAWRSIWLIGLGLAGLVAFIFWEWRHSSPVLELRLFHQNRLFTFSSLAAFIHYSATFAVTFLMSLYLQQAKGLTPQLAGFILVAQPAMMALFSPLAGRLSDRIEPRIVASLGMLMTTLALVSLIFLEQGSSLVDILARLAFLGVGYALFSSPNMNAIMSSVEKRYLGIAAGTVGTMRLIGQMFSMGIVTLIFAVTIGRVRITSAMADHFLSGMHIAFTVMAALCLVGFFASMVRGKLR